MVYINGLIILETYPSHKNTDDNAGGISHLSPKKPFAKFAAKNGVQQTKKHPNTTANTLVA